MMCRLWYELWLWLRLLCCCDLRLLRCCGLWFVVCGLRFVVRGLWLVGGWLVVGRSIGWSVVTNPLGATSELILLTLRTRPRPAIRKSAVPAYSQVVPNQDPSALQPTPKRPRGVKLSSYGPTPTSSTTFDYREVTCPGNDPDQVGTCRAKKNTFSATPELEISSTSHHPHTAR